MARVKLTRKKVQNAFGVCAVDCRETACKPKRGGKPQTYGTCMRACLRKRGVTKKGGAKAKIRAARRR
jgi:hypothetical protein